jgi:hypothetical protein
MSVLAGVQFLKDPHHVGREGAGKPSCCNVGLQTLRTRWGGGGCLTRRPVHIRLVQGPKGALTGKFRDPRGQRFRDMQAHQLGDRTNLVTGQDPGFVSGSTTFKHQPADSLSRDSSRSYSLPQAHTGTVLPRNGTHWSPRHWTREVRAMTLNKQE